MTAEEYVATVEDFFSVQLLPAEKALLPEDRPLEGFVSIATSQTASPDHVRAYHRLATRVSERVNWVDFLRSHGVCGQQTPECQTQFVDAVGAALFRRPLETDTRAVHLSLFSTVAEAGANFEESGRSVLQALLQAPQFLYRVEREKEGSGQTRRLDGYEIAVRLSYGLLGTAPGAALLSAAEEGRLDSETLLWAQAETLLNQKEEHGRTTTRFLKDWARLESLPDEDGLKDQLTESAVGFYNDLVLGGSRSLALIWTAPYSFLTPALAERDGLVSQGPGVRRYESPDRAGLLSQPGVIAGMTNADGGDIVARGLFLLSQVYCADVLEPSDSLQESIEAFVGQIPPGTSARGIAEARLERADCAACHQDFDPLGYGFERYDFRGARREVDEFGNPVRDDGWVPTRFAEGLAAQFASASGLVQLISESEQATACMVRKNIEFLIGLLLEPEQEAAIEEVRDAYLRYGGTHAALIRAIVEHPIFWSTRRSDP